MNIGRTDASLGVGPRRAFTLGAIVNGDVILIYSRPRSLWGRVSRFINVGGQRLLAAIRRVERVSLFRRLPSHTHAMIGIGGGLVIHADGKLVTIDVISDIIRPEMDDAAHFVVYRHQLLPPKSTANVVKAAYRYYSQSYGFAPYFGRAVDRPRRKEDTTQFCSRLIAHAYRTAGHELTKLTDNRVLPLDLFRICQGAEWCDVTAEFVEEDISEEVTKTLGKTDLDTVVGMSLEHFLARSEQTMRKAASVQREFLHMQHKSLRNRLNMEEALAEYVRLQLETAYVSLKVPDSMDESDIGWVKSVLAQLPALLDLALVPDIECLVTRVQNRLMIAGEESNDQIAFVGLPAPAVVQQMRVSTEVTRIYAYLLLADLGMRTIASWLTQSAEHERFTAVGQRYGEGLLAVVPLVDRLAERLAETSQGFLWVDSESDRTVCRGHCDSLLRVLQQIDVVRRRDPEQDGILT